MLSPEAQRVKAFCKRVTDYEKVYQEYWKNEQAAREGEDEEVSEFVVLLDSLEGERPTAADLIKAEKIPYCRLMAKARGEVWDLIEASPLTPLQRRIMIDRYNRAYKWRKIRARSKLKYLPNVYQTHNVALERMVPVMQKMYPNWKEEDARKELLEVIKAFGLSPEKMIL